MPPTAEITQEVIWAAYQRLGTVEGVADELGVSRHEIGPIIDEMPLRQVYRHRGAAPKAYSDDDLKAALRTANESILCRKCVGEKEVDVVVNKGKKDEHVERVQCNRCEGFGEEPEAEPKLTLPFYHALAPKLGLPAAFTITQRLGPWATACKKAGVKAHKSTGPREGTITLSQCLVALRICRADLVESGELAEGAEPSYERYVKWARDTQYPSGPTVRAKVADYLREKRRSTKGAWRKALEMAYHEDQ